MWYVTINNVFIILEYAWNNINTEYLLSNLGFWTTQAIKYISVDNASDTTPVLVVGNGYSWDQSPWDQKLHFKKKMNQSLKPLWHGDAIWFGLDCICLTKMPVVQDILAILDAIWWHRSGSTLVQVMACCLTATSHYLNPCWLFINGVPRHSPETLHETATSHAGGLLNGPLNGTSKTMESFV